MAQRDERSTNALTTLAIAIVVVAVLYFAQDVFLPFALSILLSFLLFPIAHRLERWGLRRIPSVVITVALAFLVIGGILWVVADQLVDLTADLPKYRTTLIERIRSVKNAFGGESEVTEALKEIQQEVTGKESETAKTAERVGEELTGVRPGIEDAPGPLDVRLVDSSPLAFRLLRDWLGPVLAPLGTAAIVIVFVIFMLLEREDLRDRFIRLAGTGRVYVTTQAMDEAAARVSRYLLMQLIVNASFGLVIWLGLWLIGLPNALLWGMLAMVMRFLPYIGPWLSAVLPIALSLAVFPDWTRPLLVLALFVVNEVVSNNVVEPWLYGTSTGVSVMGIILAAVFWTWLWGPIGLVLATPLTVCVVVMGRYIPQLNFLNVLLSDQPAIELHLRFYQRLLSFDDYEANEVVAIFLRTGSLDELYEKILIPALSFSERDRHAGYLNEEQANFIYHTIEDILADLDRQFDKSAATQAVPPGAATDVAVKDPKIAAKQSLTVLCLPAEDTADRLAGQMLSQLLRARGHLAETWRERASAYAESEVLHEPWPEVIVISALAPGGASEAREAVRKIRPRLPSAFILVGLWNARGPLAQTEQRLKEAGADFMTAVLSEGINQVDQRGQLEPATE